jgi:peroxiredoxin
MPVGSSAPEITALTLEGDTVALSSFLGQPLLVNLWATWCVPCRRETPYLESLHRTFGGRGLRVVGITVDRQGVESEIRAFLEEFDVGYTVLHDPEMVSVERFAAPGLPATYLIDRDGIVRHAVPGPVEEGNRGFRDAVLALLD